MRAACQWPHWDARWRFQGVNAGREVSPSDLTITPPSFVKSVRCKRAATHEIAMKITRAWVCADGLLVGLETTPASVRFKITIFQTKLLSFCFCKLKCYFDFSSCHLTFMYLNVIMPAWRCMMMWLSNAWYLRLKRIDEVHFIPYLLCHCLISLKNGGDFYLFKSLV